MERWTSHAVLAPKIKFTVEFWTHNCQPQIEWGFWVTFWLPIEHCVDVLRQVEDLPIDPYRDAHPTNVYGAGESWTPKMSGRSLASYPTKHWTLMICCFYPSGGDSEAVFFYLPLEVKFLPSGEFRFGPEGKFFKNLPSGADWTEQFWSPDIEYFVHYV